MNIKDKTLNVTDHAADLLDFQNLSNLLKF